MRIALIMLLGLSLVALGEDAPAAAQGAPAVAPAPAPAESDAGVKEVATDVLKGLEDWWSAEGSEAEGADVTVLNVQQCVEMALSQNPQVLLAEDDVFAAKERIGQAQSALYPQVKAQVAFIHIQDMVDAFGGGLFGNIQGKPDKRNDSLTITQVLFAGGQIRAAIKASEFLAQSQEWQRQAKINQLEFDTKKAYFDCLLARSLVRVAEGSVKTFERHRADIQQMLEVGLVSNFELLRAQTELGARKADEVAARNMEQLALLNLRRILCVPQDKRVRLAGELNFPPLVTPVDELVQQAFEKRPELLALAKGLDAAEENIKRLKGQYLPKAAANAQWSNTDNGGSMMQDGWTFTVGGEMDVFTGGRRKHQVNEAKSQRDSLEHQRDDIRKLIELEVRASQLQAEDAAAKIRSEKGTVDLGREGLRLAQLRFQEGVGTQTETIDAELALTAAETKLVQALHDYTVAQAMIQKAIGNGSAKANGDTPVTEAAPAK